MSNLARFTNKVFCMDAKTLLAKMPDASVKEVMADVMYMVAQDKGKSTTYDWGPEPGNGSAEDFWAYHQPIYDECRRVLRPGGVLAWCMASKHIPHFDRWFGEHRRWAFARYFVRGRAPYNSHWMVQTKEQQPIRFPDDHGTLELVADATSRNSINRYGANHPCPKSIEEMLFMVKYLSSPGDTILDCCCGLGTTLVAAKMLGRNYIGCDLSEPYVRVAKFRLSQTAQE